MNGQNSFFNVNDSLKYAVFPMVEKHAYIITLHFGTAEEFLEQFKIERDTYLYCCRKEVQAMPSGMIHYLIADRMKPDELYLGVLCHLITDMVWFHEIMETQIRFKVKLKEERQAMYQKGYEDFIRLCVEETY